MKTYKNITRALGISVVILLGACNNLLDLQPQTSLSDATAFSTPDRIALAVTGVYDAAQSGFYSGGAVRGYPFGAAHVEQGDNRGEDVVNTQAFFQITYQTTYDGTTANNDYHWQTLWALINRANVVLAGLATVAPTTILPQASIDAYKGECQFLRALAYHELLKHFCRPYSDNPNAANGGVPIHITAVTGASSAAAEAVAPRASVAANYAQIISDLDYAESVLPATRASNLHVSRATKGAAIALKTRIYQHMGNWAKVVTEANKLVPAGSPFNSPIGGYKLTTNPYTPFGAAASRANVESIFSIENDATDNPGVNGSLPQVYVSSSAAAGGGRALVAISPILWNQTWFNSTDARKGATFVYTGEPASGTNGKGGYFTKKYTDVATQSDNAPVIRYAEVILNLAEAIQRQALGTPDSRAFDLYNSIRSRANTAGSDASYDQITDFATGTALLTAIYNERRIEFVGEGLRWGDIHRLAQDATFTSTAGGIPVKISSGVTTLSGLYTGDPNTTTTFLATAGNRYNATPYTNFRFLWPIPNSEIQVNAILAAQQNPGY